MSRNGAFSTRKPAPGGLKAALTTLLSLILLAGTFVSSSRPAAAAGPVTVPLTDAKGLTLLTPFNATHWAQVWDLTQGDLTLSYTLDLSNFRQPGTWDTYNGSSPYVEVGLREEGAPAGTNGDRLLRATGLRRAHGVGPGVMFCRVC